MPRTRWVVIGVIVSAAAGIAALRALSTRPDSSAPALSHSVNPRESRATRTEVLAGIDKPWRIVRIASGTKTECNAVSEAVWQDAAVTKWVDAHAIVVPVDADQEPKIAAYLSVDPGRPIIIAFKGDVEFDRIVGRRSPRALLDWMEGLERGEKSVERIVTMPLNTDNDDKWTIVENRWRQAVSLANAGSDREAADDFLWLWRTMPSMFLSRPERLSDDTRQLLARSPDARGKFDSYRATMKDRIDSNSVSIDDVFVWVDLNRLLDRRHDTLEWFDRIKSDRRREPLVRFASRELGELLIAANRWADLCRVYPDPMFSLEQLHCTEESLTQRNEYRDILDETRALVRRMRDYEIGLTYASLLASKREAMAGTYAAKVHEYFPGGRTNLSMAQWALAAGEPRRAHVKWLSEEPQDGEAAALAKRIEKALQQKMSAQAWS